MNNEKERIKFGYGNVVPKPRCNCIEFVEYKISVEVGQYIQVDEEIIKSSPMKLSLDEAIMLKNELKALQSQDTKIIEFKNYILDFTNYNPKSISIMNKSLDRFMLCQRERCEAWKTLTSNL